MTAGLDVVIPTRDRPDQLTACLAALAGQHLTEFGVIVVDDGGSTPAAGLIGVAGEGPPVRFVRNEHSIGPGASRNRGAAASHAPYLVFLDDDCIADPDLLVRHHTALAGADGPVVSLGPIRSVPGRRLPAWTHWDADRLEREYDRFTRGEATPDWTHLYTGNVGLRRSDFVAIGGFDTRFARQEDVELGYRLHRLGAGFTFDPAAVVHHDSDRSLSSWRRIPAASARFDELMDRLVPDSGRLAAARTGLASRHRALRAARRLLGGEPVQRCAVAGAIAAGCLLHALRLDRPALAAFSLVWDLTYSRALEDATADRMLVR